MANVATEPVQGKKLPDPKDIPQPARIPSGKASIVTGNERAPAGWKRFKVRGENDNGNHPPKYVVAKSEEDAEAYYYATVIPADERQIELDRLESIKQHEAAKKPIEPSWKRPYVRLVTQLMPD